MCVHLKHTLECVMYNFVYHICHCNFIMMILKWKCDWEICCLWLHRKLTKSQHYNDVIMGARASQIISLTIVYSTVHSRRRSKKTSKLRATGLCKGNSPVAVEFPAQRASNAEKVPYDDVIMNFDEVIDKTFVKMTFPLQWNISMICLLSKIKM